MLIVKYTPDWISNFTDIKQVLDSVLQGLAYTIEHVGSTAVPDLDAKPIIDIDIIYSPETDFGKIKTALETIGYYHNGNQGIEDREAFKRNGVQTHEILDNLQHHLYVCPVHSKALERHLLSRDYLRKHTWARLKYQQMKYEIAEKAGQDRKIYAALKELTVNDFIDTIIAEEKAVNQDI